MSGGGSKLLNDPQSYGPYAYETTNFGSNTAQKITVDESGLYYVQVQFSSRDFSNSQKIEDEKLAQFQLIANNITVAFDNHKFDSTMSGLILNAIAKIDKGNEFHAYVHTSVAGVKFNINYTIIKLRGDGDA